MQLVQGKNPQVRTWFLRNNHAKICQLGPLKFEIGTYFPKWIKKNLHTWADQISQHSESSLET